MRKATDPLPLFIPITKVVEEGRMVYGVMAEEAPDKTNEILDWEKGWPEIEAWSESFLEKTQAAGQDPSRGNVRVQHDPTWVCGKVMELTPNHAAKKAHVAVHVSEDRAWSMVKRGELTGFSPGGSYKSVWSDPANPKLKRYVPSLGELSLVDNPCMRGATFTMVKASGAEETVTLPGEPAVAVGQANDALSALKALAAELALLPGEPDTWALQDVLDAIRNTVSAKAGAELSATKLPAEIVDGAGPEEPAVGDMQGDKAAKTAATAAQPTARKTVEKATDSGSNGGEIVAALQKVRKAHETLQETVKAMNEGLGKTVGETVTKAVQEAKTELQTSIAELEKRVKTIEAKPAPAGRPVQKRLGGGIVGETTGVDAEKLETLIKSATEAGASKQVIDALRMEAANALMHTLR